MYCEDDNSATATPMAEDYELTDDSTLAQYSPSASSSSLIRPYRKRLHETEKFNLNPKKDKKSPQSDAFPILPYEIIIEILSWLPVRTLIQFRCVSKTFKSLISDPQFIKTHLRKITASSENKPNLHERIVFAYGGTRNPLKSCSLYSIFNSVESHASELKKSKGFSHNYDWLVGSCDGLLCVAAKQKCVALWNPATRAFNRMPNLDFPKIIGSYTVFGLGYDGENDDYKVVSVFCFPDSAANGVIKYDTRVQIGSPKAKCWRSIGGFGYGVPHNESGQYVSGCLCWSCEKDSIIKWDIVSFDLAKETYNEVMQPNHGELGSSDGRSLGVLDGCLCVMYNYSTIRADFWVMKEYGVAESWTKVVSIPYAVEPVSSHWLYSVPFYIADSGKILLEMTFRWVIYDPKDGTFTYPVINDVGDWFDAKIYIESLVSPRAEN